MTALELGEMPIPVGAFLVPNWCCKPPVLVAIIGVPHAIDSNVARPKPSASEMLIVQSAKL